jgi:hypothetical protein
MTSLNNLIGVLEKEVENLLIIKKQLREIREELRKLQMRTNIINNFI